MSRTASPIASAILAATSCLSGDRADAQAPQLPPRPEATQSFWIQFADGALSKYEVSGWPQLKGGEALWVPYNGGTRLGMVRANVEHSLRNRLVPPQLLPRVEPLAAPRTHPNGAYQLAIPSSLSPSPASTDTPSPEQLRAQILYSGPTDLRDALINTAVDAQSSVARAWFGRTPKLPSLQLKVEIAANQSHGSTRFDTRPDKPLDISVEVRGNPEDLPRIVRREFARVVAYCSLGKGVPLWFEDGLASSTERRDWQDYYQQLYLHEALTQGRDIPLTDLFARTSQPLTVESSLFSGKSLRVIAFLIDRAPLGNEDERKRYVANFISEVMAAEATPQAYNAALWRHYGIQNVSELDRELRSWRGGLLKK